MYKKMKLKGVARIEPDHLGDPLEAAVERALRDKYEGVVDKSLGTIVAVLGADDIGEGHILAGDGSIYYEVNFDTLVFKPEMQEIIEGEVVEIRGRVLRDQLGEKLTRDAGADFDAPLREETKAFLSRLRDPFE